MFESKAKSKAQIALEFLIVYSFVLLIFILIFYIISTQNGSVLNQQQYSLLQLESQNIASYISLASQAGPGYSAVVALSSGAIHNSYNISISTGGVVIASTGLGNQNIVAYGFGHAKGLIINGTLKSSANGTSIYQIETYTGSMSIHNSGGIIYIDEQPPSITDLAQSAVLTQGASSGAANFNGTSQNNNLITLTHVIINNSNTLSSPYMSIAAWVSPRTYNCTAEGYGTGGQEIISKETTYPFGEPILGGGLGASYEMGLWCGLDVDSAPAYSQRGVPGFDFGSFWDGWTLSGVYPNGPVVKAPIDQWTFVVASWGFNSTTNSIYQAMWVNGVRWAYGTFQIYSTNTLLQHCLDHLPSWTQGQCGPLLHFAYNGIGAEDPGYVFPNNGFIVIGARTGSENSNCVYTASSPACPQVAGFNGYISDVQIYNTGLDNSLVQQLYQEGIGGVPLSQNLSAWWPLNNNARDYSGYGQDGIPNDIYYTSVIQVDAHVISYNGNNTANDLVGFVSSKGYMAGTNSSYYNYAPDFTGSDGVARGFVTGGPALGSLNVTADVFNANTTTEANLIGWWPLDTGFGVNAVDLSTTQDSGNFFGSWSWNLSINETNFVTPIFPGELGQPYIEINQTPTLNSILIRNNFTAVAWVYENGTVTPQGIFGDFQTRRSLILGGFQIFSNCDGCILGENVLLDVNEQALPFPNGISSFPLDKWMMVTAEYNNVTGNATVYLNKSVFSTGNIGSGLSLNSSAPYVIGLSTLRSIIGKGGSYPFNGSISNVQLYGSDLSQQQITQLYSEGIGDAPLARSNLVGWWPLLNNTLDYSTNASNGALPFGGLQFINSEYNNTQDSGTSYLTLNGFGGVTIPYNSMLSNANNGIFSVSMWFSSGLNPTELSDSSGSGELFDSTNNTNDIETDTYYMQLCGSGACGISVGPGSFRRRIFPPGIYGEIGDGSTWLNTSVNYPFDFVPNSWYNVVETFNATQGIIYLNGQKVTTVAYNGVPSLVGADDDIMLGSGLNGGNFTGQIADVQVYDSVITPQQAAQLYIQGLPKQYRINVSAD
jgi:Concanavalin A-like lectin/glucanases superfamily